MEDYQRIAKMSDATVQDIWDAIWELDPEDRPNVEWQEDIYAAISDRGLRSSRKQ